MGTTRSGLYLNTAGSRKTISDYALVHSVEGTYINVGSKDPKKPLRLDSGGHGQDMFKILKKAGVGYTIAKTYPNGVRIGNVENHKSKAKRLYNKQTWFPKNWTKYDILRAGLHVASLAQNKNKKDGEHMIGKWKGVMVVVIKRDGVPQTITPCFEQPNK